MTQPLGPALAIPMVCLVDDEAVVRAALARPLRSRRSLPVIFLTAHGDEPTAPAAVKRGAFDLVEKPGANEASADRIELALAARAGASTQRRTQRGLRGRIAELTERERDAMHPVIDGRSNKRIAEALGIGVHTGEVRRARVFEKMDVGSAVERTKPLREFAGSSA